MTNAQKYEEIFGFPPDVDMCPTIKCEDCPLHEINYCNCGEWWDYEHKEPEI